MEELAEGSILIKITGDTGNLESKLKQLEAKIKQLGTATDAASALMESGTDAAASALEELESSADSAASAVDEFVDGTENASTASKSMGDAVKEAGDAAESAESDLSEMSKAASETADNMDDTSQSSGDAADNIDGLGAASDGAADDVDKLGESSEETSESVDGLGDSANQTGSKFASFKTMVAGILAADIVKTFVDKSIQALKELASNVMETGISFDTAMSQVAATMGTTTDQIAELEITAKNLGSTTAFTATEAAEGLNILAQSGLSATEQMAASPDVLNLAAAGATSLDNAASYVTGTIKGFGDSMDNAQYYVDLMAKGATLANTNVSGLGEALSDASATAETYGQSAESVTLSLLRLAEQNVVGTEASTALSRAMMDLYTPTDTAKAALDDLGVAVYDSSGKARDFNDVVDDLNNALSGMSDEQKLATANTIFTTYGLDAFNKMTKTSSDKVEEFKEGLSAASGQSEEYLARVKELTDAGLDEASACMQAAAELGEVGSAAEQAATQMDNLGGDITIFQSATEGLYQAIYEKFEPAARLAVQGATSIISGMTSVLTEGAERTKVSGERVVLQFLNGLTEGLPGVLEAGTQAVENFLTGTIANIPSLAASALRTILAWAMYLRLGATSIINAGAEFITTLAEGIGQHLPEIVQAAVDTITGFVSSLIDNLPQIASTAVAIVSNLASTITQNVPTILAAGVTLILSLLGGIIQSIPSVLEGVATLVTNICDKIGSTDWISVGANIITILASGISGAVSFVGEATMAILDAIVNYFSEHWNDLFEAGKNIVLGLKDGIVSLVTAPVDAIHEVCDGILNKVLDFFGIASPSTVMAEQGMYIDQGLGQGITDNQDSATTPASTMAQAVFDAANGILSTASSIGRGFVSFLSNGITSNSGTASGAGRNVATSAASGASGQKGAFSTAGKTVGSAFSTGIQNVQSAVSSAAKTVSTAGYSAASALKSQYQEAGKIVISAFQNGINGQKTAISSAAKAIAAAGHAAASATKSSWLSVGLNLAAGLAAGIRNGASSVISAATSIAKNAISAAKSALGIASPSRVMRDEVGIMISRGVAVGISNAESYVSKSSKKLSDAITDNFKPSIAMPMDSIRRKVAKSTLDHVRYMLLTDNNSAGTSVSTAYTTNNSYHSGEKIISIDYHPEQKCDEPVSARRLYEINTANARQLGRTLKHV
ncbi:MAG: phage tail tape measure protein [Eubacteriales bacterium]|nr:phage tail tape measure protein [Eubacteriales bacterium]